jgi:hypothetical protein
MQTHEGVILLAQQFSVHSRCSRIHKLARKSFRCMQAIQKIDGPAGILVSNACSVLSTFLEDMKQAFPHKDQGKSMHLINNGNSRHRCEGQAQETRMKAYDDKVISTRASYSTLNLVGLTLCRRRSINISFACRLRKFYEQLLACVFRMNPVSCRVTAHKGNIAVSIVQVTRTGASNAAPGDEQHTLTTWMAKYRLVPSPVATYLRGDLKSDSPDALEDLDATQMVTRTPAAARKGKAQAKTVAVRAWPSGDWQNGTVWQTVWQFSM